MEREMEARIDGLLEKMTLREKLGQLTQAETVPADRADELKEQVRRGEVGSILMSVGATAGNTPQGDINTDFYNELQRIALEESRLKIPLIFGRDVIHGHKTVYPIPLAMAASFDFDLVQKCYEEIAEEAANEGVHWAFAPMLDLSRDPRWGRIVEGCGEDPFVGCHMARAVVKGFQGDVLDREGSLLACAKHFVGYGASEGGRDYCHAEISDYALYNNYLPPFREAIRAGVATIMSSFNDINGEPVTASKYYLSDILHDYLGYDGLVVSDYAAIHQLIRNGVAEDDCEAAALALNGGIDIDMVDSCFLNEGEKMVLEGRVSMNAVDRAVRNVLRVKFAKGLFKSPYCKKKSVDYTAHRRTAREIAAKSVLLLKNEGNLLPIKKDTAILLVGEGASERESLLGSWALDGKIEETPNFYEAMSEKVSSPGCLRYDRNCEANITDADIVVFALCEDSYSTGENACISHISISDYEKGILRRAKALGKKLVGVFFYGRPIAMQGIAENFDAIIYAWHGGCEVAHAAADILFGDRLPCGKTPVTFPRLATHLPLYYNCYSSGHAVNSYYGESSPGCYKDSLASPYYPFGYGLTYSVLRYGNLLCDRTTLTLSEVETGKKFEISVELENIGSCGAEETVQLYVCDRVASISRPIRELKAFRKIHLKKGQFSKISFALGKNELGYYNKKGDFTFEPGDFDIYIGSDCLTKNRITISIKKE